MADEVVIRAEGLTKRYAAILAVDHIDFEVHAGEIVGILGPNGSGKTTTILMLLGLTEPSEGRAVVAGFDPLREPLEVKRLVGYLPDTVGFYDGLSARDNLAYTGRLAGLSRREIDERFAEALGRVGLPDVGRGALSPELEAYFRVHLEDAVKGLRDRPIVFYCLADCWMSWNATKRAAGWGYTQLYWYRDGIDAWEAAKLPTENTDPVSGP